MFAVSRIVVITKIGITIKSCTPKDSHPLQNIDTNCTICVYMKHVHPGNAIFVYMKHVHAIVILKPHCNVYCVFIFQS